ENVPCSTSVAHAILNCPRRPAYWVYQCAANGTDDLSTAQLAQVANLVNGQSTLFDWSSPLDQFCSTLSPGGTPDLRQQARREFASFLANFAGNRMTLGVAGNERIVLDPGTPISCPAFSATTIEELAVTARLTRELLNALYVNNDPTHRRALEGVNFAMDG